MHIEESSSEFFMTPRVILCQNLKEPAEDEERDMEQSSRLRNKNRVLNVIYLW